MKKQAIVAVLIAAMMVVPATAQKRKTAVRKKAAPVVELTKEEQRFEELLDATQQIMFIDSIVVDKQEFLNFYKLTSEAGTVTNYNQFFRSEEQPYSTVYINQLGNKWQSILSLVSMFVPIIFVFLFEAIFDTTIAYTLLIVIGLAFTLTEPYWMRNIYVRMMRRKYSNLEGFHASR